MALERSTGLSELAGSGFIDLDRAQQKLSTLATQLGVSEASLLEPLGNTQDPDQCLELLARLTRDNAPKIKSISAYGPAFGRLCKVLGASTGLFEFLSREPAALGLFMKEPALPDSSLEDLTKAASGVSEIRIAYRLQLLKIAILM
jgi:glutamate-ammonia-ligase adenylyltransferase